LPRDCKYVARIDGDQSEFPALFEAADRFANGSDRWAEIQPGYMAFYFEKQKAHSQFLKFVESGRKKCGSDTFQACRKLVHDDAFEAKIARHMVTPLLQNALKEMKTKYLYDSGVFFRRAITRYFALISCRLLEKPNERGKTGVTASIASLLDMAETEALLTQEKIVNFRSEFEKIKADAADGEYDLVKSLHDLRTIQVAHSLIPWKEPTDQVWAHHLIDFVDAIFRFVVALEAALAQATGTVLEDLELNAEAFRGAAGQFWRAQTTLKFLAEDEPPSGKLAK
jgi:hypothetical protein